ncbi:MAG TPA: putative toxin-antitoxin system toxin component, PIN family [Blastocatellia bacterium]
MLWRTRNTVVSGLFWHGAPRLVLDAARQSRMTLFTTPALLLELEDVLKRDKFSSRLTLVVMTPRELVLDYAALCVVVDPAVIQPTNQADPDDDEVLACAVAASADVIVSGDSHLIFLNEYQGTRIMRAPELVTLVSGR